MKRYLALLIVTLIMASSSFAQGEYITNDSKAIGFKLGYIKSGNSDVRNIQLSGALSRGVEFGVAYGESMSRRTDVFEMHVSFYLRPQKTAPPQFALTSSIATVNNNAAFSIAPVVFIDNKLDNIFLKYYFSIGVAKVFGSRRDGEVFYTYGISPYWKLQKHTILLTTFSITNSNSKNNYSFGLGIVFGFEESDESKNDIKKKRKSYYDR